MELTNHTRFPADLYPSIMDEKAERFAAAVVARITYDIVEGRLEESDGQSWPVSRGPWDGEHGKMDGDESFVRDGVDLLVFGFARSRAAEPVRQLDLHIRVGSGFHRHVVAVGDRLWLRVGKRLIPSPPEPFTAIPLTLEHAYGGKDQWDGLEVPLAENPDGKGFILTEDSAEGKPLPNFEDPENPIRKWDDRPEPIGFGACLIQNPMRVRRGTGFNEEGFINEIRPSLFNSAFPGMIVESVNAGDRVLLEGFSESGAIEFTVPECDLRTRIRLGDKVYEKSLSVDQIGIEVDRRRAFITYRYPFRYRMVPLEKRMCEIFRTRPDSST